MFCRSMRQSKPYPDAAPRPTAAIGHICQFPGCAREVPSKHLMCREHWFEVPAEIRNQVEESMAAWLGHKDDVRPYLVARLRAIIHVAKAHSIAVPEEEAKLARRVKDLEQRQPLPAVERG
jgi:hypothetical protein